jgi:hypothetical protein
MNRIVIALVALIGISGAAFAESIDVTTPNARAKFSNVETTSYVAASLAEQGQYQVFNP